MFKKVLNIAAEVGWANMALLAANRFLADCHLPVQFIRYHLVAQPVAPKAFLPAGRGADLTVRVIQEGDPGLDALPLTQEVLRYRYAQGGVCLGIFKKGAVIGSLWFCFGSYLEDEVRCQYVLQPAAQCAWDYGLYIAPSARGGIAFLRLWDEANRYLRARGINWSLSRISAFNAQSSSSHARLGAQRVGSLLFLKAGLSQLALLDRRPFVHLSTSLKAVPSVEVRAPAASPKL
jgi:hypothetical protein